MIKIEPGKTFEFANVTNDHISTREKMIEYITQLTTLYFKRVTILNKTKKCNIEFFVNHGDVIIIFKNPDDDIFNVNEGTDAETQNPVTFTGR